jgi:predicted dehydrogenase
MEFSLSQERRYDAVMLRSFLALAAACLCAFAQDPPLRLAIAGLEHGHVSGFLHNAKGRPNVQIVGVFDADANLRASYAKTYSLTSDVLFDKLDTMLERAKPEAVATFTSTFDHAAVVEACARRHIPVMMEKPLATTMEQAGAIQKAAQTSGIPVMVNYETTWYPSHGEIWKLIHEQKVAGDIRRMVAMDGHQGPKEIHVQPEFLGWLTDPVKNGAGALFDFGCYGANLMTWIMDNARPQSVTAMVHTNKPETYGRVDDEATIVLQYAKAQGVIEASWNWPYSRKDFEVYGANGYAIATGGDGLRVRLPDQREETRKPDPLSADEHDSITYLTGVARGKFRPAGLNSLENNVIVVEILQAARESARSGRRVALE